MFSLAGKCAVVVGGTSGIGKAIALGLASAGANVIASSRSKQAVGTVADCLEQMFRGGLVDAVDGARRARLWTVRL